MYSSYAGRNVGMSLDRILHTYGSGGEKKHPHGYSPKAPEQELCRVDEIPLAPQCSPLGVIYKRAQQGDSYTRMALAWQQPHDQRYKWPF